ncbi:MAG: hypothetical protein Q7T08_13355 [Devosia sp.]|nr:hypothetical protein [Devosia sp.]
MILRQRVAGFANMAGALLAAVAVGSQAYANFLSLSQTVMRRGRGMDSAAISLARAGNRKNRSISNTAASG